jgi:hypothetical protein
MTIVGKEFETSFISLVKTDGNTAVHNDNPANDNVSVYEFL